MERRLDDLALRWRVEIDHVDETPTSLLAFGRRDGLPVVLKLGKEQTDELRSGRVLEAFNGFGTARVYESVDGAMLLERLAPATPLSTLSHRGEDDNATAILTNVIAAMSPAAAPPGVPWVREWSASFDRYLGDRRGGLPQDLVTQARHVYLELSATQQHERLLHGDLHHDNVLFDATRGWIAVDPKGVVGELEFEIGAALRNPLDLPGIFTDAAVIDTRVRTFSQTLHLDPARVVSWGFAQAVLATIWLIEDGAPVVPNHPWLELARALRERCGQD